jgi:hypothetical protein
VALPPLVSNIVAFLRAGYPEGVPEHDYLPLFALLTRRLSDDEVIAVADELEADGDQGSAGAIRTAIHQVTRQTPLDKDVARVSARLAAAGWPLASPHEAAADGTA